NAIIEYLVKAECTDNLITSALEAVEYVDHSEFSKSVVEKLIGRNSRRFFYRSENGTSRFRAAGSSVRFIEEFLPPFSVLLLDGIHDSEIMKVFGEFDSRFEGTDVSAIRHLSLVNLPGLETSERLRICRNITTLYLGNIGWMKDLNAL